MASGPLIFEPHRFLTSQIVENGITNRSSFMVEFGGTLNWVMAWQQIHVPFYGS